jgi:hypothetical protein
MLVAAGMVRLQFTSQLAMAICRVWSCSSLIAQISMLKPSEYC